MNQSDRSGDQSMEEILASIRDSVDSAETSRPDDAFSASLSSSQTPPPPNGSGGLRSALSQVRTGPEQPGGRLTSPAGVVVSTAPDPSTPPTATPPEAQTDSDLSDLFEDPTPQTARTSSQAVAPPQPPRAGTVPFGSQMAASAAVPPSVTNNTGPSQRADPSASASPQSAPARPDTPAKGARPAFSGLGPPPPATPADVPKPATGSDPVVIASMDHKETPDSSLVAAPGRAQQPARSDAHSSGVTVDPDADTVIDAATPRPARTPDFSALKSLASGSAPDGKAAAPATTQASSVLLPEMRDMPSGNPVSTMHSLASAMARSNAVKASAASINAAAPSVKPVPSPADVPSAAPSATADTRVPAPAPLASKPNDTAADVQPAAASRSLEDVVVDLLKPQLQNWLEANMPRIVERALRAESEKAPGTDET